MRRFVTAVLLSLTGVLSAGMGADAHALMSSSTPADGANLERAPTQVSITFTEWPDPRLSVIHVLNVGGRRLESSGVRPVPGDRSTLTVALPSLPNGVYTVTWTTVSAVDGHVAGGFFAFGVGASPTGSSPPGGAAAPSTPPPSPLGIAGRWLFYVGLAVLLGGTWISLFAFRAPSRRLLTMAGAGVGVAVIGLAVAAEAEREAASVTLGDFVSTSLGGNLLEQVVPIALAGVALAVAWRWRAPNNRVVLGAAGALALVAIFTHVLTTHASASHVAWLMFPAQWAHLTAFCVWIGGLSALLIGVRGLPRDLAARAVRRFSFVAAFALVAVGVTGALRAIDEVGALSRLWSTVFGGLVLVKVGLFVVLAGLGAINRYRNVPRAEWSLTGLHRVGRFEVAVAAVVIGVAAVLTALPPPSYTSATAALPPQQVVVDGHDQGTTVRVRLIAIPGYPGSNRFTVSIRDYDTGRPVDATRVALRFAFPGRPNVGESTLELKPKGNGSYSATAPTVALAGRWSVTVVVEHGLDSAEVPLMVTTAAPPERISAQVIAGLPTVYTVELSKGRSLQLYVDPGTAGNNAVHATFFQGNAELPMTDGTVISATPATGPTLDLQASRFDKVGHFIGQGALGAGRWRFDITATSADGDTYQASFEETIK
ncbi:MAG TPA: FixH family protein [Candidatus Dormibacteraeota bacterium]|nr:FixH family protein [Candidatus Dormibacteraeota bacterium]